MALWVEKHHGADGPGYIEAQIDPLVLAGAPDGVAMWRKVAERLGQLQPAETTSRA
ncbi:MAG: hypothetical protein ABIT09_08660 [Croceibacterium sp.]